MKLNALILLATILIGFTATSLLQTPPKTLPLPAAEDGIAGKTLPEFSVQALDGTLYHSKDFVGRTVFINFWASWCPPCIAEFPRLLELARAYPDDLVLLAVSSDQDRAAIEKFTRRLKGKDAKTLEQENVLIVHDKNSAITFDIFQTVRLPETIIVSPQQQMVHKLVGVDWTLDDAKAFLQDR